VASFDNGLALGADGLELDVRLSKDGQVVVHHDAALDRTTNASGPVADLTAAELGKVDAGYRFQTGSGGGTTFPFRGMGIGVPTLAAVFERYPGVPLIIELKLASAELARKTLELATAAGALQRIALGSFSGEALRAARRIAPSVRTGAGREETRWALYRSWVRWPLGRPQYQEFQVPERSGTTTVVTRRFVEHAHRAGVAVKVWTVDEERDMHRLLDWGVDGLISDRPDIAVRVVSERASRRS